MPTHHVLLLVSGSVIQILIICQNEAYYKVPLCWTNTSDLRREHTQIG